MQKTSRFCLGLIMTMSSALHLDSYIDSKHCACFVEGYVSVCITTVIFSCARVCVLPRWLRVGDGQFMQEARGNEGYAWHWAPPSPSWFSQLHAHTLTNIERQMSSSKKSCRQSNTDISRALSRGRPPLRCLDVFLRHLVMFYMVSKKMF